MRIGFQDLGRRRRIGSSMLTFYPGHASINIEIVNTMRIQATVVTDGFQLDFQVYTNQ